MAETAKTGLGIDDIIGDKREAALAAKHGAFNVRVFGSVARGEARPDSDVDFVIEFPDGTSIFDLAGLWDEPQTLLGREVDLVTPHKRLKDYMRREIERDAIFSEASQNLLSYTLIWCAWRMKSWRVSSSKTCGGSGSSSVTTVKV